MVIFLLELFVFPQRSRHLYFVSFEKSAANSILSFPPYLYYNTQNMKRILFIVLCPSKKLNTDRTPPPLSHVVLTLIDTTA